MFASQTISMQSGKGDPRLGLNHSSSVGSDRPYRFPVREWQNKVLENTLPLIVEILLEVFDQALPL